MSAYLGSTLVVCKPQAGASLLVAMVILVALSFISISSMKTAIFELKMANNSKQQSLALNNAEELLLVGENRINDIVTQVNSNPSFNNPFISPSNPNEGFYLPANLAAVSAKVGTIDWSNINKTQVGGGKNYFVVEYLGQFTVPGNTLDQSNSSYGDEPHAFRVSVRSEANKAVVLLQSVFITKTAPI